MTFHFEGKLLASAGKIVANRKTADQKQLVGIYANHKIELDGLEVKIDKMRLIKLVRTK